MSARHRKFGFFPLFDFRRRRRRWRRDAIRIFANNYHVVRASCMSSSSMPSFWRVPGRPFKQAVRPCMIPFFQARKRGFCGTCLPRGHARTAIHTSLLDTLRTSRLNASPYSGCRRRVPTPRTRRNVGRSGVGQGAHGMLFLFLFPYDLLIIMKGTFRPN